jgi:hypothetical protein
MILLLSICSVRTYLDTFTSWSRQGSVTLTSNQDGSFSVQHTGTQDFNITGPSISAISGDEISIGLELLIIGYSVRTAIVPFANNTALSDRETRSINSASYQILNATAILPVTANRFQV